MDRIPPPRHSAFPPQADTGPRLSLGLQRATDMSRLDDARLRRAYLWWQGLHDAAGMLPDRSAIDLPTIRDLLPYAILWDVTGDTFLGLRYRCRLTGTMLVEMHGRESGGMWLEQMYGAEAPHMQREMDAVVHEGRPLQSTHSMAWASKGYYRYRRLMLPFSHRARCDSGDDPHCVALLFNVISFIDA